MFTNSYIRKLLVPAFRIYERSIHLVSRSEQPYATHIPVLIGVAAISEPRRLIEFGSGTYSTLSFLNKTVFPSVEKVDSYENNQQWFEQVREKLPADSRINLHYVQGDMYRAVESAHTSHADMVFIDDSPTATTRVPTVEEVARVCGKQPIIVLHDNDLWRLRLATLRFEYRISFNAFNPQSCVMWHGHPERVPALKRVNQVIRQHVLDIELTDIQGWINAFSRELM